jgi:hypothetical protein
MQGTLSVDFLVMLSVGQLVARPMGEVRRGLTGGLRTWRTPIWSKIRLARFSSSYGFRWNAICN